jgi:hypothetical protein
VKLLRWSAFFRRHRNPYVQPDDNLRRRYFRRTFPHFLFLVGTDLVLAWQHRCGISHCPPLALLGAVQLWDGLDRTALFVDGGIVAACFYAFFALMIFSLTRKWMPFVRVAEKVFKKLDWPNPGNIDLVRSSKAQRRPDDPGEFGTFYFRY